MRLLFISTLYPPYIIGGAEISTQLLVESLLERGHDVGVISTTDESSYTEIVNGVNIFFIKHQNIYWKFPSRDKGLIERLVYHTIDIYNFLYGPEIVKIINDFKPNIIHTQNLCGISTYVWKVARDLKIPTVHTLRDYYLMCPRQSMYKKGSSCSSQCNMCRLYSLPKRRLSVNVNAVVGISNFILAKHMENGFFKNSQISKCIANSVKYYGTKSKENKKTIGYIGRISEEKGVSLLADAFMQSNSSGWQLEIAGVGSQSYIHDLENKYNCDTIKFLGHVESNSFFERLDLLVVPSLWDEPFGRVVIEAYAHGIPVFVSKMGGLPELVNKFTGRIFSVDNTSELTALLSDFFRGVLKFDNERIQREVELNYTEEVMAIQYESVYFNLLKSRSNENCSNS